MTVANKVRRKSSKTLLNEVDDPKLIKAVVQELRRTDAKLILAKLEDLEKAIYHIAGKQQDMMEAQKELEKMTVATATTIEEMVNGIEIAVTPEDNDKDEEFLIDAWGGSKKAAAPTSN